MKKLNLNDIIKVKLTPLGVDIFYHRHDDLNKMIVKNGGQPLDHRMPRIDKDGFTEFQLWDFINLYGSYFKIGVIDQPIKDLNIYIDDKDLEDL